MVVRTLGHGRSRPSVRRLRKTSCFYPRDKPPYAKRTAPIGLTNRTTRWTPPRMPERTAQRTSPHTQANGTTDAERTAERTPPQTPEHTEHFQN